MRTLMAISLAALVAIMISVPAQAENFRVTTEISEGDTVHSASNTIFFQGRVFDSSDPDGNEFTVYDPTLKRIRLINIKEKIQTQLPTDAVARFTAQLKLRAPQLKDAFFLEPNFKDESNEQRIRLAAPQLTYEAETTSAKFPGAVEEYRSFADWICQLNAMNPRNLPPFPRMELNQALHARKSLPLAVRLRLPIDGNERVIESKHRYYWVLSRKDRELCERIGGYLADPDITIVDFKSYRSARVARR